jgi:hypothetical protein
MSTFDPLVHEEPTRTAGRYRVTAPSAVLGYEPGETFEQLIPPEQEARLIARGQLEVVGGLTGKTREELNDFAAASGVTDPESLPNKDAVAEAIEATTQKAGE